MAASWQESCNKPRQYVKKERHQFADKVHIVNPTFFPVLTYSCESWNTKKAEKQRIDAFELWCWESIGQQRSNQSILKAINPEYSLEGLMLKLKLQYFGHLKRTADSKEKTLVLGRIESWRKSGWQRIQWTDAMGTNLGKHQEMVREREAWGAAVHEGHKELDTAWQLSNLATTTMIFNIFLPRPPYPESPLFTFSLFSTHLVI